MSIRSYFDSFTERDWDRLDETEPVRFALVGLGWWVLEQAMPAIAESDYCETSVLVSRSAEKAADAAADHDGVEGISAEAYHAGDHADQYDAVYVCTPNATHLGYVETAAELGKDVLCEKPIEVDAERAYRLVDACDRAGVTLMIAYRMQTEPAVRRMRDFYEDGLIGDLVQIHGSMSNPLLDLVPDPDQWRLDPELSGGCATIDIGLYSLNTSRFLVRDDPRAVQATTHNSREEFDDVDESVAFVLEFPDNVVAVCSASQNAHDFSHIRLLGTAGELTVRPVFLPWQDRKLHVSVGDVTETVEFDQIDQMTEEFDYFADCLLDGRTPVPDGEHGARDIEVIEAVYEAAETGRRTEIDYR